MERQLQQLRMTGGTWRETWTFPSQGYDDTKEKGRTLKRFAS